MIVALLNGTLEFLQLQTFTHGKPIDWNFTCAYRRTHVRTGSAGSISDHKEFLQVGNLRTKIFDIQDVPEIRVQRFTTPA